MRGSGRMKVDDEIVGSRNGTRCASAGCVARLRGRAGGPEEILVIGAPNLGEAPRDDVDGQRDWWADSE